jgi:uncharacterized protein (DUF1015 family)
VPPFRPFRGVRYDPDRVDLAAVTAPPYDVIDARGRAELAAKDPCNVVTIDVPAPEPDAYEEARTCLERWLADGILRRDDPSFYVYRMSYDDSTGRARHTTGVFGSLELSRPGEGAILPHEHTTPKAKSDRLSLLRATRANLSAVWALSPSAGLTDLLGSDPANTQHWTNDGVRHSLWTVTDPARQEAIAAAIAAQPVVVADGHHRYETSLTYRDEQRERPGDETPGAESVLAYVVELLADELDVQPIHRLISGLPDGFDVTAALEPFFAIEKQSGGIELVTKAGSTWLTPRPEAMSGVRDLDSSRLDVARAALPDHEVVYQHDPDEVRARVASGEAQAGFLLRPATVDQIVDIAHGGERMPPKTTFFSPKPRTGVVFRLLDE